MAIAMERGEMRWSPTGLVSCRKEFGFVLRTKESRMGTKCQAGCCAWEGKSAKNILIREVSAKGWGTADLGISSASWIC